MKTKAPKATLARLIERAGNLPPSLVRAVVRRSGGWESFTEKAPDVNSHGASGGFSGWIYYTETVGFTRRNRKSIIEVCESLADDFGMSGPVELVRGFNCLKDATEAEVARTLYGSGEGDTNVANALAWFALEEVSRAYCDMIEDQ